MSVHYTNMIERKKTFRKFTQAPLQNPITTKGIKISENRFWKKFDFLHDTFCLIQLLLLSKLTLLFLLSIGTLWWWSFGIENLYCISRRLFSAFNTSETFDLSIWTGTAHLIIADNLIFRSSTLITTSLKPLNSSHWWTRDREKIWNEIRELCEKSP